MPLAPRVRELLRTGNRAPFGVGGTVYSDEFSDFAGMRGDVARMYRAQSARADAILRGIRRRDRDFPREYRPYIPQADGSRRTIF